jgi:hypothetical protein
MFHVEQWRFSVYPAFFCGLASGMFHVEQWRFFVYPAFFCGLVIGMFHVEQFGKPLIPGKDAGAAGPVPRHDAPI